MDEYWADDGEIPAWRKELRIGKKLEKHLLLENI